MARFGKPLPSKDGAVLVELERGAAEIAPVVRALDEAGLTVEALDLVEPSLDDVFLDQDRPPPGARRAPTAPDERRMNLAANLRVIGALGVRSVKQTLRRPQLLAPIIIIPSVLLAIQTAGAGRAVDLPGFPQVNGFLDFMLAGAMIQATLLAGNSGGIALAVDIEMGFTDRLLAAPIARFSIVLGRLAGTAALGALSAVWFIAIGLIFGAQIEEGVGGAVLMMLFVTLSAVAFGGLGAAIALRTGRASVVQGLFPLVFVILFLSSAFFPDDLMLEPAATVARVQPPELHRRGDPRPGDLVAVGEEPARGARLDRRDRGVQHLAQRDRPAPAPEAGRLSGGTQPSATGGALAVGWRADLETIRALVRRASNELLRVPGAAIPGVLAPTIFFLGLTSVFGNLTRCRASPPTPIRAS